MKTRRPLEKIAMKKAFLIALLVSFASHALVLSMPVMGNRIAPPPPHPERSMTIELAESLPPEPEVREAPAGAGEKANRTTSEEQTVNLESPDRRYRSYLLKVRQRIESRWSYPEAALKKGEQGIATVKFTIENRGVLSGQNAPILDGEFYRSDALLPFFQRRLRVRPSAFDPLPDLQQVGAITAVRAFQVDGLLLRGRPVGLFPGPCRRLPDFRFRWERFGQLDGHGSLRVRRRRRNPVAHDGHGENQGMGGEGNQQGDEECLLHGYLFQRPAGFHGGIITVRNRKSNKEGEV